ncbi:hypothetical protein GCM10025734_71850 [Kitasatospora paranensis]
MVLGILGLSQAAADGPWAPTGAAFALLGAGFAAVMVTATGTVVGDAPPEYAGVVGGLKQTAVNIGPLLGIAVATGTGGPSGAAAPGAQSGAGAGGTLLALAGVAALGLVPAGLLPDRPLRRQEPAGAPVTAAD